MDESIDAILKYLMRDVLGWSNYAKELADVFPKQMEPILLETHSVAKYSLHLRNAVESKSNLYMIYCSIICSSDHHFSLEGIWNL